MKFQKNLNVFNKNILLRVDLNVSIKNDKIIDNSKIIALKKTIKQLISKKNRIFLLSHFGRPKGKRKEEFSLRFLSNEIKKNWYPNIKKVTFIDDCIGNKIKSKMGSMQDGEVCLLENVRFYKEEMENKVSFSKKLSINFDYYINDAFSCSHRKHSSIVGVTKFIPSYAGLLFEKEIINLKKIADKTTRPSMAIIGGSKISTKIKVLKNLVKNLDYLVIGGAMANTFLAARGYELGSSLIEKKFYNETHKIEKLALKKGCKLILPIDVVTSFNLKDIDNIKNCKLNEIEKNKMVLDIGKASCNYIIKLFPKVKTVLWNGPLGAFEYKPFDYATIKLAKKLALKVKNDNLNVVIGGGDMLAALKNLNITNKYTYVSTSGGAFLEWFEGNELPGIRALNKNNLIN